MSEREQLFDNLTDLTEGEKNSQTYLNYETRPHIFPARESVAAGLISQKGEDIILKVNNKEITVPPEHQYDMGKPTMFGLNESLVLAEGGVKVREAFDQEQEAIGELDDQLMDYGNWAYYPRNNNLIHYTSEEWHTLAQYLSNSSLLMDPDKKLTFQEIRERFYNSVIVIIGLSVGNDIGKAIVRNLQPKNLIVADPALYKLTNANRVTLRSTDMVLSEGEKKQQESLYGLRPKWQVFAEQIHEMNPYPNIYCYPEATKLNLSQIIGGNRVQPKASVVIDVCDTIDIKIAAAEETRRQGVVLIRATDAGSTTRMDISRFDIDHTLPISYGIIDSELYRLLRNANIQNNKDAFFEFADALVGPHTNGQNEFGMLIRGELPRVSTSVPQLGSTAMMTGAWVAEIVGRLILGHEYPERVVADFNNLTVTTYGERYGKAIKR